MYWCVSFETSKIRWIHGGMSTMVESRWWVCVCSLYSSFNFSGCLNFSLQYVGEKSPGIILFCIVMLLIWYIKFIILWFAFFPSILGIHKVFNGSKVKPNLIQGNCYFNYLCLVWLWNNKVKILVVILYISEITKSYDCGIDSL